MSRQLVEHQVMMFPPSVQKDSYFPTMHANDMLTADNRKKKLELEKHEPKSRAEEAAIKKQKLQLDRLELEKRVSQVMNRVVVQKKKNYNKGEARTTDANKEKDLSLSDKDSAKGKETFPKDWKYALLGHIVTFIEMQELSTGLGPR